MRNSFLSQKVLVKLDFANAFNCVSRQVALREVAAKFPGLARFATWCYQMPSSLRFGSFTLESQTGWSTARRPSRALALCCSHPPIGQHIAGPGPGPGHPLLRRWGVGWRLGRCCGGASPRPAASLQHGLGAQLG